MRLGEHDLGPILLHQRLHLLFSGNRQSPLAFRLRLGDLLVRFGLFDPQSGADVVTHIDVSDVDGEDLESGPGVEPPRSSTTLEIRLGFSSTSM